MNDGGLCNTPSHRSGTRFKFLVVPKPGGPSLISPLAMVYSTRNLLKPCLLFASSEPFGQYLGESFTHGVGMILWSNALLQGSTPFPVSCRKRILPYRCSGSGDTEQEDPINSVHHANDFLFGYGVGLSSVLHAQQPRPRIVDDKEL